MPPTDALERGRAAYLEQSWGEAYRHLRAADEQTPLGIEDLERLGLAAYLNGHEEASRMALERTHQALLSAGETARAVRWAIWLAIMQFQTGHNAQGGGWMARAQRLLDGAGLDGAERGYLLVPSALQALGSGEPGSADELFTQVGEIAERCADTDLQALGLLGRGQAAVALGRTRAGVTLLDEAMVAVTTGEASPLVAGIVYCAVISACRSVFDVQRAQEWTAALTRWCDAQQDLHPYRGQCLVHRSEILQLQGEWEAATAEIERACDHLAHQSDDPVMGMARYQQGELLRLRGDLHAAETAYREASRWGHSPHPGLALLRLAQGRVDDAAAAIGRVVDEAEHDHLRRARVLAAQVEIALAGGDHTTAVAGVEALDQIATGLDATYLRAVAVQARGAAALASGAPGAACEWLRQALTAWQQLDAPYEAALVQLALGQACRELGDHDTARLELDAARTVFDRLGAAPALARVAAAGRDRESVAPGGLTPREVEVLELVATGATNRQIAQQLVISEKTVARHLSNMFTKLDVSSRAAATAWAYEHDLR